MDADDLEALTAAAYERADASGADVLRQAAVAFTPGPGAARDEAVLGGAWLVTYKLGQRPADLLATLAHLKVAQALEPSPPRAANLAAALLEAMDLDGTSVVDRAGLHTQAVELLQEALASTPEDDDRWVTRATIMASALLDAVNYRLPGADLDRALDLGERLVRATEQQDAVTGEPYNLLGTMLLAAADRGDQALLAGDEAQRQLLLYQAAETGLDVRPSVALAAARQLAADGLVRQVNGHHDGAHRVDAAAGLGFAALGRLIARDDPWRHSLSWYREAQGMGALTAQSRLINGNASGALAAFDDGHAALLRAALSPAAPGNETGPFGWTVSVWCTLVGGGAVVTDPDGCPALAVLPEFTLDRAQEWTRRLASAARLSNQVMAAVLQQVLPGLSRLVTEPVSRLVPRDAPLTWCVGGVAAMLPVAAADAADRTPLMLRHLLRQAPTPSIARITAAAAHRRAAPTGGGAWTIAAPQPSRFPPLPAAAIEMATFADPGHRLTGTAATVSAVRQVLAEADLVHVGCHARTTAADPLTNHLLLAGDEPLFADDIVRMTCPARIVVLAACDTAAVGSAHADEALGLAGAFIAAGVPGVIASLWSVGDEPTGRFMSRLGAYLRDGLEPDLALYIARVDHRGAGEQVGSWAAFTLLGA